MAKNLVTISLDQLQENGFDAVDGAGSAEEQYLNQTVLLAEGMEAAEFHINLKESNVTDTKTTYDSGLADPEAPLADHIELAGGVEALVSQMVAAVDARRDRESAAVEPDLTGYSPVTPLIEGLMAKGLEWADACDNFHQLVLPKWFGVQNPDYITEFWLNEDGPTYEKADGTEGRTPTEKLVGVWFAGKTPSVVYVVDGDPSRIESDFPAWEAVSMRTFRSAADVKRHIRSQRPGFRPQDVERARQQLASAREALADMVPAPFEEDPRDDGF